MASTRQLVSVHGDNKEAKATSSVLPAVFLAPIRPDIVQFVHTNMNKNHRQAYGVKYEAGMGHSAESWGTGRAVARVPRVSGGGTSRAGQGAFANMCRKGRMFNPTRVWRKWHRKINTNQKRFAVASALAASALPSLVMGRGHRIEGVPEVPLVLPSSVESIQKTKDAVKALKAVNAYADVEKAGDSRKIRRGVGKMRNRRHVMRRGPLVVYAKDQGIGQAFRNLPGVEVACVDRLNLLQLAPGGHLGRFIIWTQAAFDRLNAIWGSVNRESTQKKGYKLPRSIMTNSDLTRIINSDEVQTKVRPVIKRVHRSTQKKNPLKNLGAMVRLNPYALSLRRSELLAQERRAAIKAGKVKANRNASKEAQRAAAAARTHEPQQKVNYARLQELKVPEVGPTKVHKPRAKLAEVPKGYKPDVTESSYKKPVKKAAKPDDKPKARKAKKEVSKKGPASTEEKASEGPAKPAMVKRVRKVRVISVGKASKKEDAKKGKGKAEAPKGKGEAKAEAKKGK